MTSTIKERLDRGQLVRVMAFGGLAIPKLVEIAGRSAKIDGVWFDQEHSAISHHQLELLLIACRSAGLDAFARIAPTDYTAAMRPYEAGCSGVMVAQVRTLAEVKQAVAWAKYPPHGRRGVYSANAETGYGEVAVADQVVTANRNRWLAIQIETVEALDVVGQIAAVEEVNLLFVGPSDLSVNLGVPGEIMHPKCVAALEQVSHACQTMGKPWGAVCPTPEHARRCRELGCQLFSFQADVACFRMGLSAVDSRFAEALIG